MSSAGRELERLEAAQADATKAAHRAASAAPELAEWIIAHDRALAAVVRVLWVSAGMEARRYQRGSTPHHEERHE